jgi:hypothetical protein
MNFGYMKHILYLKKISVYTVSLPVSKAKTVRKNEK